MRQSWLLAALTAATALAPAACAGHASRAATPSAAAEVDAPDVPAADDQAAPGRPAGVSIIQFGPQRTIWLLHCPTDSTSPLREQCSLTRADVDPSR